IVYRSLLGRAFPADAWGRGETTGVELGRYEAPFINRLTRARVSCIYVARLAAKPRRELKHRSVA
ncbi:MAG TPA: hypothetical protein VGD64_09200, partial [Acidisarcina sp.]